MFLLISIRLFQKKKMFNFWKRNFDTFVNVAVLISIVALISFFTYRWLAPVQQDSYKKYFAEGQILGEVPYLNEDKYGKSVVLMLNTGCRFCNESLDFYKKLADSKYDTNSRQLVALFSQPEGVVSEYAKKNDFQIRSIPSADFQKLNIGLTPTILVIDQKRKIIKSWFGKLNAEQETEVFDILEK